MAARKGNGIGISTLIFVVFVLSIILSNLPKSHHQNTGKNASNGTKDYQIQFSDQFKPGLASQDDLGLSVCIAIDCSGSMSDVPAGSPADGKRKYQMASESLTEIVSFLEDYFQHQTGKDKMQLKIALLKFSSDVTELFPLRSMDKDAFRDLKAITGNPDSFTPDGQTAIGMTMERAVEILSQSGTIFRTMIIITDGENNVGVEPETVMKAIVDNSNNKTTKDFPVSTSSILVNFVGFDSASSTYDSVHHLGARVTTASNKEQLNQSLKSIFVADIKNLEAK
jgi:Mg-chelatase subunit ChlD